MGYFVSYTGVSYGDPFLRELIDIFVNCNWVDTQWQ